MKKILIMLIMIAGLAGPVSANDEGQLEFADYKLAGNVLPTHEKIILTPSELIGIYSGKILSWDDGTRIKVLIRPMNDYLQRDLVTSLLYLPMGKFREYVKGNKHFVTVKRGRMLSTLMKTPGALGIISIDEMYVSDGNGIVRIYLVGE